MISNSNIYHIYIHDYMYAYIWFLSFFNKGCLKRWGPVGLGLTGFIWWFQIFLMKLWRTEVLLFCCRSKVLTSWLRHFKRRPGMRTSLQLLSHNLEGVCCLTHKKTSKSEAQHNLKNVLSLWFLIPVTYLPHIVLWIKQICHTTFY